MIDLEELTAPALADLDAEHLLGDWRPADDARDAEPIYAEVVGELVDAEHPLLRVDWRADLERPWPECWELAGWLVGAEED